MMTTPLEFSVAASRPQLLVSVRSAQEAEAALSGGADLIDIKEPARGSLGKANDEVIDEIVARVGGRRPVSAALGEWHEGEHIVPGSRLSFVKWGLAGMAGRNWRAELEEWSVRAQGGPAAVAVAYADWQCAQAPAVEEVIDFACRRRATAVLIDTHCKTASSLLKRAATLLDWLPLPWIVGLCERCRQAGVRVALAGSLDLPEMAELLPARPDWFAVRGAACAAGEREAAVAVDRVRRLRQWLDARSPLVA